MRELLFSIGVRNRKTNTDLRVPKKYQERFAKLEAEEGLIDDCKYILYFAKGWALGDNPDVPVKSKAEAIRYLKEANRYDWE